MKKLAVVAFLSAVVGQSAFAQAQTENISIWDKAVSSSPDVVALSLMGTDAAGNAIYGFDYSGTNQSLAETFTNSTTGQSVTMNLTQLEYDSDPSVRFAFGVNNPDGAVGNSPYSFTFATPTTLTAGNYSVHASIGGSMTNGESGSSTVSIQPNTNPNIMQSYIGASTDAGGKQDAGVDLISSTISSNLASGDSYTFPAYSSPTSTYALSSSASQISVTTSFDLSNSDSASFTGRFDVTAVSSAPEPTSVLLGAMALAGFAYLRSRRCRA